MATTVTKTTGSPSSITIASGTAAGVVSSVYSPDFNQRLSALIVVVALAVIEEDSTVPAHPQRIAYAKLVVSNPTLFAGPAAWSVVADGVTSYSSSDQDIVNRLIAIWTDLSNVG